MCCSNYSSVVGIAPHLSPFLRLCMSWREDLQKLLGDAPPRAGFFRYEIHYMSLISGSVFIVDTYAECPEDALSQTKSKDDQFIFMKQIFD